MPIMDKVMCELCQVDICCEIKNCVKPKKMFILLKSTNVDRLFFTLLNK